MTLTAKYYIDTELGFYFELEIARYKDIFGDYYYTFKRINDDGTGFNETANSEREARDMMNHYIRAMYWGFAEVTGEAARNADKAITEGCLDYMEEVLKEVYGE